MKLRKTIKRIVALGTGAAMLGATVMGAMAADLNTYPSPFVKDGALNALILIGDSAKTSDVIGAIDIATSLQYAAKQKVSAAVVGGGTVSLTGDSDKVEKSTNKLEVSERVNSIAESVTGSDLTGLKANSITNEYGTFDYTQTIYLPHAAEILYAADPDDSASVAKPYMVFNASKQVYKYKIAFTPALKSDHNTGSSGYLEDIKDKKITLFGKTYTILKADHTSTNAIDLTLMGGAVSDIMSEGDAKTFTVGGKEYKVTLDYVGTATAKFTVNGETTTTLNEGDTYRFSDGIELGIVDVMAQDFSGGVRKVDFNLGADKIKISDSATNNANFGATITVGSEDLTAVKADIVSSSDGGTGQGNDTYISSIEFQYNASSALYLAPGDTASAKADVTEAQDGNFLVNAFDYKYEGLQVGNKETISLVPSGSNNYKLKFTNKAGIEYSFDVIGSNSTSSAFAQPMFGRYTGSAWNFLVTNESENITDEAYFIVSKNDYSRILQFKDINPGTSTTDNMGIIKVKDLGSGDLIDVTYSGSSKQGNLVLDGNTYIVQATSDGTGAAITADFNGDGILPNLTDATNAVSNPIIRTQYGATIELAGNYSGLGSRTGAIGSQPALGIIVHTEDKEDNTNDTVLIGFKDSGDKKLDLNDSAVVSGGYNTNSMVQEADGSYKYGWYTKYGAFVEVDRKGSGSTQNDFTVTYPDEEATGAFFVTIGDTTASASTTSEGTSDYYTVNPIVSGMGITAAKLASAVTDLTKQNIIVVGGPCVNSAAASLMGFPSDCAKDFTEGKAMIKLYQNGDNVALLVAGYSAADTLRAAQVVANNGLFAAELKGTEVEVSGTSFADVTVAAPAPKVVAPVTTTPETTA